MSRFVPNMQHLPPAKKGLVSYSKFFLIHGIIFIVISLIFAYLTRSSDKNFALFVILLAPFLCGSFFIILYINCRINYNDDTFTSKNFFGIKHKYSYHQITGIQEKKNGTYIILGEKKIMVDSQARGKDAFIIFVCQKYKKIHNGRFIPIK